MFYTVCKYILKPLVWILFHPKVTGRENLCVDGKAIFVSNHICMIDPVALVTISPRDIHFMAKAELFKNPFTRLLYRSLLAFPVERNKTDMASIKKAMHVLDDGEVFGIFPEGKRSITGDLDDFEKGAAFLASRSDAPVIPVYIHKDSYSKRNMRIAIGEKIDVAEFKKHTPKSILADELTNEIHKAVLALKNELEGKA